MKLVKYHYPAWMLVQQELWTNLSRRLVHSWRLQRYSLSLGEANSFCYRPKQRHCLESRVGHQP